MHHTARGSSPKTEMRIVPDSQSTRTAFRIAYLPQNVAAVRRIAAPARIAARLDIRISIVSRHNAMRLEARAFASQHDTSAANRRSIYWTDRPQIAAGQIGLHACALGAKSDRRTGAQEMLGQFAEQA